MNRALTARLAAMELRRTSHPRRAHSKSERDAIVFAAIAAHHSGAAPIFLPDDPREHSCVAAAMRADA